MTSTQTSSQNVISAITYTIPSATRPDVKHTVSEDVETGARRCNCEASDHAKTAGKCWHLKSVNAGLVKPVVRISQRPARPAISDEMLAVVAALDV